MHESEQLKRAHEAYLAAYRAWSERPRPKTPAPTGAFQVDTACFSEHATFRTLEWDTYVEARNRYWKLARELQVKFDQEFN